MFRFRFECLFLVIITLSSGCGGCVEKTDMVSNRVYFTFEPTKRYVMIPVQLNDSVTANMMFDTGSNDGAFILDSTIFASHPELSLQSLPTISRISVGWAKNTVENLGYNINYTVKIGDTELTYTEINITNWKAAMYDNQIEGLFSVSKRTI